MAVAPLAAAARASGSDASGCVGCGGGGGGGGGGVSSSGGERGAVRAIPETRTFHSVRELWDWATVPFGGGPPRVAREAERDKSWRSRQPQHDQRWRQISLVLRRVETLRTASGGRPLSEAAAIAVADAERERFNMRVPSYIKDLESESLAGVRKLVCGGGASSQRHACPPPQPCPRLAPNVCTHPLHLHPQQRWWRRPTRRLAQLQRQLTCSRGQRQQRGTRRRGARGTRRRARRGGGAGGLLLAGCCCPGCT
jgi:hypothetical protein